MEVPEASMDQLCWPGRGARGKVIQLHHGSLQPPRLCVQSALQRTQLNKVPCLFFCGKMLYSPLIPWLHPQWPIRRTVGTLTCPTVLPCWEGRSWPFCWCWVGPSRCVAPSSATSYHRFITNTLISELYTITTITHFCYNCFQATKRWFEKGHNFTFKKSFIWKLMLFPTKLTCPPKILRLLFLKTYLYLLLELEGQLVHTF